MRNDKIKAEPFDCMQYFYRAVQQPLIRCCISFTGHVDTVVLNRAVNLSASVFPLINYGFDEKRHCWIKRGCTAGNIVHVVRLREDGRKVSDILLNSSINVASGPQLNLFLLVDDDWDTLCIIINHMVSDGGGFKQYLYLLASLYSECEKNSGFSNIMKCSNNRSFSCLLRNLSFDRKLDILLTKSDAHIPDPAVYMPLEGNAEKPFIAIRKFDTELFFTIRNHAHENSASINDMLLTAYMRALHHSTGSTSITVPCPVDLRKYMKGNTSYSICNLTANYRCNIDMVNNESFDETLKKVSSQMRLQKKNDGCLKMPILYHMAFCILPFRIIRKLFYKLSPIPVTSYTNLGVLDSGKLGFGSLKTEDAFISTAVKNVPYFQVSVSTFENQCTMSSSLYGTEKDKNTVNELFDFMQKDFESLI